MVRYLVVNNHNHLVTPLMRRVREMKIFGWMSILNRLVTPLIRRVS